MLLAPRVNSAPNKIQFKSLVLRAVPAYISFRNLGSLCLTSGFLSQTIQSIFFLRKIDDDCENCSSAKV